MMVASEPGGAPSWSWGTTRQLWACRLSHALGLVVVLGMLVALGATSSGQNGPATATAAEIRLNGALAAAEGRSDGAREGAPAIQERADCWIAPSWAVDGLQTVARRSGLSGFSGLADQPAILVARLRQLLAR